ncbi:hypothetical protein D3C73_1081650 [compost metagenome]
MRYIVAGGCVYCSKKLRHFSRGPLYGNITAARKQAVPPQLRERGVAAAVVRLVRREFPFIRRNHPFHLCSHHSLQKGVEHISTGILTGGQIAFLGHMRSQRQHRHGCGHLQEQLPVCFLAECR